MEHPYRGVFIAVEGIDGCGKGTAVQALKHWAEQQELDIFDMESFCKRHNRLPSIDEIEEAVIIAQEPTFGPIGKTIREELARNKEYSANTLAHAFALDREIYYRTVILPAKKAHKFIFQERSVFSTLTYQGLMQENMLEYALELDGNRLALHNGPDLVLVITTEVETALARIHERQKQTGRPLSRFENAHFLSRVQDRFTSDWFKQLAHLHSTELMYTANGKDRDKDDFMHHITSIATKLRLDRP